MLRRIRKAQLEDTTLVSIREELESGETAEYSIGSDDILRFRGRICVPADAEIRRQILSEGHSSMFTVHPGTTKMYRNLRTHFWWSGMKRDVAKFVARCAVCHQVKAEHLRPGGYYSLWTFLRGSGKM